MDCKIVYKTSQKCLASATTYNFYKPFDRWAGSSCRSRLWPPHYNKASLSFPNVKNPNHHVNNHLFVAQKLCWNQKLWNPDFAKVLNILWDYCKIGVYLYCILPIRFHVWLQNAIFIVDECVFFVMKLLMTIMRKIKGRTLIRILKLTHFSFSVTLILVGWCWKELNYTKPFCGNCNVLL